MKIPEINYILSDREIADMVDGIYKQNHEYYIIDENGFILGYKDQKGLAEKEYLTELLCKWRNINRWLNNGASPYERVTLAMIEEKEKERATLYRQIENALNGKFAINNNQESLPIEKLFRLPNKQKSVQKQGRQSKPFKKCLQNDDGFRLQRLHAVMKGKKGKEAALTIKVAIQIGWITKPTFKAVEDEFGDIGNRSNYNKYINEDRFTNDEIDGMKNTLLSN